MRLRRQPLYEDTILHRPVAVIWTESRGLCRNLTRLEALSKFQAGTTPGPVFPTSAIRLGIPAEDDTLKAHVGGPFGALLSRAVKDSAETRWTSRQQSRPKATVHIGTTSHLQLPRSAYQFSVEDSRCLHFDCTGQLGHYRWESSLFKS